jgi:dihydrofolate reductase
VADLIYTANVSLDGYVEDADGNFDFMTPADDYFAFITELERSASTYVYGRRMYEAMAVWETEPALREQDDLRAAFADMWQAADKVVHSTSLPGVATKRTQLVRTFDPAAVRGLKESRGGHLTVGGANLAAQAFAAGLVDECRLFVAPALLGGGKPALPRDRRVDLTLVEQKTFSRGVVYLRYRVTN